MPLFTQTLVLIINIINVVVIKPQRRGLLLN